jgi:hypothetical protein
VPGVSCLFFNKYLIVFFYVDDLIACCLPQFEYHLTEFKEQLMQKYEMKDLGEAQWFLGIRIIRHRPTRRLWLCQDSYIDKIAGRFHQKDALRVQAPFPVDNLEPYDILAHPMSITGYQQKIGSALYAVINTRPDCARCVSRLSEFMLNPSPAHHHAIDRVIAYLYQTKGYAILFDGYSTNIITRASDASFADDTMTRKSSQGYILMLFNGCVDWRSTKQSHVTKSSTDAELTAVSSAIGEFMWWQRLFSYLDLVLEGNEIITVLCDNQQTIRLLTKDGPLNTSLKHVDIHGHWLRQEVRSGAIKIKWITTAEMIADGFTKALSRQKHQEFVKQLNLDDVSDQISILVHK